MAATSSGRPAGPKAASGTAYSSRSAVGGVAGAGVGLGTAAGIFAAVSAAATASTGTAIASLSGAAATSATLAWLGGGYLAAGGMGVAGGTSVLGGIVALPAVLAMGGVLAGKGIQMRRQGDKLSVHPEVEIDPSRDSATQVRLPVGIPRAGHFRERALCWAAFRCRELDAFEGRTARLSTA